MKLYEELFDTKRNEKIRIVVDYGEGDFVIELEGVLKSLTWGQLEEYLGREVLNVAYSDPAYENRTKIITVDNRYYAYQ